MISDRTLGALALAFYLIHAGYHVASGHPADALWACHLANLVAAIGFWWRSTPALNVALMWLLLGNAMWAMYLFDGGEFTPTSLFTHVGGLGVAAAGCWRHGVAPRSWLVAAAGLAALQVVSRLVTPPADNINIAWRVYDGWENAFPNYAAYIVSMDILAAGSFFVAQRVLERVFSVR